MACAKIRTMLQCSRYLKQEHIKFQKINKTVYVDHDGKRVYFCCAGCIDSFKKEPAKHIKKLEGEGVELAKVPVAKENQKKQHKDDHDHAGHNH